MQPHKIIEELQSIEAFAEILLKKCYSVRQLLTPGDVHPRASFKKKSQNKINLVIANRNKSIKRKSSKMKSFLFVLLLFGTATAQTFSLPPVDSLYADIDNYFDDLAESEIEEFKESNKRRWLNYLPSPGYSPFTGGLSLSFNISAPLQEIKNKHLSKQKIASIKRLNRIQCNSLKNEVYADFKALQISINEYHLKDSAEYYKQKAFNLADIQYQRNEITPTEYLSVKYQRENFKLQRIQEANLIYKSILLLLIKSKKPMHSNAPALNN